MSCIATVTGMNKEMAIGIDIGGTKLASALVDRAGSMIGKTVAPTPMTGSEDVLSAIREAVVSLMSLAARERIALKGIGIGSVGLVDYQEGIVVRAGNLPGWNDVPLRRLLQAYTPLPVWVDNDVNAMALGEHVLGAARGCSHALCVALGTGVGGGMIADGKLFRGAWNGAGEFGHVSVDAFGGERCSCGMHGCLQLYASGKGIAARYRLRNGADSDASGLSAASVFERFRQGEAAAKLTIEAMLDSLAAATVTWIHLTNPQAVVFGGGMIAREGWIVQEVERRVKLRGIRSLVHPVAVLPARLGADASLIGAAMLPFVEAKAARQRQ